MKLNLYVLITSLSINDSVLINLCNCGIYFIH